MESGTEVPRTHTNCWCTLTFWSERCGLTVHESTYMYVISVPLSNYMYVRTCTRCCCARYLRLISNFNIITVRKKNFLRKSFGEPRPVWSKISYDRRHCWPFQSTDRLCERSIGSRTDGLRSGARNAHWPSRQSWRLSQWRITAVFHKLYLHCALCRRSMPVFCEWIIY